MTQAHSTYTRIYSRYVLAYMRARMSAYVRMQIINADAYVRTHATSMSAHMRRYVY